jgi:hypothetical protein
VVFDEIMGFNSVINQLQRQFVVILPTLSADFLWTKVARFKALLSLVPRFGHHSDADVDLLLLHRQPNLEEFVPSVYSSAANVRWKSFDSSDSFLLSL